MTLISGGTMPAAAAATAPRRACNLSLRRSSISAAPLNLGTNTGFKGGTSVAAAVGCCCCCCSCGGGEMAMAITVAVVVVVLAVLALPASRSLFSRDDNGLEMARRRPLTPIPSAPVRDGPRIVCECLSPVAPGNPDMLRGRDVGPSASSGHLALSASEAAVTYGLVRKEGLKEMRRGPYGSSTLRR
ncbi:hypothetical protein BC827DRAFT_1221610 [Russula dissimulans]|nr:hypothetical protein BC827DRAFT_1221610 [Russula dissimulans]